VLIHLRISTQIGKEFQLKFITLNGNSKDVVQGIFVILKC